MNIFSRKILITIAFVVGIPLSMSSVWIANAEQEAMRAAAPVVTESSGEEELYAGYAKVLSEFVNDKGLVYYRGLKDSRAGLDAFVAQLGAFSSARYETFREAEKVAFWSNAYNALTLKAIIDNYPIKSGFFSSLAFPKNSIRQISGVWDKLEFQVMGKAHTLNQIEHEILRKKFSEPRVHMALVCAALSCPRLRNEPYYGARLEEQFADQTREFLSDSARFVFPKDEGTLQLSKIFEWFGGDFIAKYAWKEGNPGYGGQDAAVVNYVMQHLPEEQAKTLGSKKMNIAYLDYDWSLNERAGER